MRYLGGKKRQAPMIVEAIRRLHPDFDVYVEPFCGAMWSAAAVIAAFPGRRYILNDRNPYLMTFWRAAASGWNPPRAVTEELYNQYRGTRPVNDPMTGYLGFAMSFGGKFFGGWARDRAGDHNHTRETSKASLSKIAVLRSANVCLSVGDYSGLEIPDGSMVYLDPPYGGRTRQASGYSIDQEEYYAWAEDLSRRCTVVATEFVNPRGWPVLHDYGDTVVRHLNAKPRDGTRELLLHVQLGKRRGSSLFE